MNTEVHTLSPVLLSGFIVGYFLLLIVVAWFTSRGATNQSFFIGNKNSNWLLVAFGLVVLAGCGGPLVDVLSKGRYGGQVMLGALVWAQVATMSLSTVVWMALGPTGRAPAAFGGLLVASVVGYAVLAAGALTGQIALLVASGMIADTLLFLWAAFKLREPALGGVLRGAPTGSLVAACVLASGAVLALVAVGRLSPGALGALAGAAIFVGGLRVLGLFSRDELQAIGSVSRVAARAATFLSQRTHPAT